MAQDSPSSTILPSLPESGASPRGLGENFRPDLATGTGNYTVPLDLPTAAAGFAPDLALAYSSGQGQSVFGQGWSLAGSMAVIRSTREGVPLYGLAGPRSFTFNGQELVAAGTGPGGGLRYRPEVELKAWLIEQQGAAWRVTTADGVVYELGATSACRIDDPTTGEAFAWLLERMILPTGQTADFGYLADAGQQHLEHISWGPFRVRLLYEERPDPRLSNRTGFPILDRLRCRAIEVLSERSPDGLLRRYVCNYEVSPSNGSRLIELIHEAGSGQRYARLPALRFSYSDWSPEGIEVERIAAAGQLPPSLAGSEVAVVDLAGTGLPGVLEGSALAWRYWPNLGGKRLEVPETLTDLPNGLALGSAGLVFADLEGNGTADLLMGRAGQQGYLPNAAGSRFEPFVPYADGLPFDLNDGELRLYDVDGDGRLDALLTRPNVFLAYRNHGRNGWEVEPLEIPRQLDAELFPDVSFADPSVALADMTGDGLTDIVKIGQESVVYWPYQGHGRWGRRVTMATAPTLPSGHAPENLVLVDVDGNGLADLVYIEAGRVLIWLNRHGQGWSKAISVPLEALAPEAIRVVDFLGEGRPGLVLSAPEPGGGLDPALYHVRLGAGTLPDLLTGIASGLGHHTRIEYGTSTTHRRLAVEAGSPWTTFLPFPVAVCEAVVHEDRPAGLRQVTRYQYRDGHFDGLERRFAGFGEVLEEALGDATTLDRLTRTAFHLGTDPNLSELQRRALSDEDRLRLRALQGTPVAVEIAQRERAGTIQTLQLTTSQWTTRLEPEAQGLVVRPYVRFVEQIDHGRLGPSNKQAWHHAEPNAFGLPVAVLHQAGPLTSDGAFKVECARSETTVYAVPIDGRWAPGHVAERTVRGMTGAVIGSRRWYFDGAPFEGLPAGQVATGLPARVEELVHSWGQAPLPDAEMRALGFHESGDPRQGTYGWYRHRERSRRNSAGLIVELRDPFGRGLQVEHDAWGIDPVRTVDSLGQVSTATYDPTVERPKSVVHPSGIQEQHDYDALGRVQAVWRSQADGTMQLVAAVRHDEGDFGWGGPGLTAPSVTTHLCRRPGLDPAMLLQAEAATTDDAYVLRRYYSAGGIELCTIASTTADAAGNARTRVAAGRRFNGSGAVVFEGQPRFAPDFAWSHAADPGPMTYAMERDAFGRMLALSTTVGRSEAWLEPRLERWTDPGSRAAGRALRSERERDGWGRCIAVREPQDDGSLIVTRFTLDEADRLREVRDEADRLLMAYAYDAAGQRTLISQIDSGERRFVFDALGKLVLTIDPVGQRIRYDYDAIGRLVESRPEDGSAGFRFHYDAAPDGSSISPTRLCAIEEAGCLTVLHYSRDGMLTGRERQLPDGRRLRFSFERDFLGRARAVTYPDGTVLVHAHGPAGEVLRIEGLLDFVDHDARGRPVEMGYANGTHTQLFFSAEERLTSLAVHGGGRQLFAAEPEFDVSGNIAALLERMDGEPDCFRRFAYDARDQLTAVEIHRDGTIEHHAISYDRAGNLLSNAEHGIQRCRYDDPARPGLVTGLEHGDGTIELRTHDGAGRLTSSRLHAECRYDSFNRLREVTGRDGSVTTMRFDYQGRRVSTLVERASGGELTFVFDDLFEQGPDGHRLYVRGPLGLLAVVEQDAAGRRTSFCHLDHLGSIRLQTDDGGQIVGRTAYTAFGLPRGGAVIAGFTGKQPDAAFGLMQLGDRFFDPQLGRFIVPDTFLLERPETALLEPLYLNAFSYAANNPLRHIDPRGRFPLLVVVIVGALIGGIIGAEAARENNENPVTGFLIGALVGGLAGYYGVLGSAAMGAGLGAVTSGGDKPWTSAAVGFAFGTLGGLADKWMPLAAGTGTGAKTINFLAEVGTSALISGLGAGTNAALHGKDFSEAFKAGLASGALYALGKIALFGVRVEATSVRSDVASGAVKEYERQNQWDKLNIYSKGATKPGAMPDIASVQLRSGGLLAEFSGRSHSIGPNTISLTSDDVNVLSKGDFTTLAHELRHIAQQRAATFGWVEFALVWLSQDSSLHYKNNPSNTTLEPYYGF